jgi:HAD superfamily hydrolase (TIGR01509 family)
MMARAVAFDLGGTLVQYYEREQFPPILAQGMENVYALLSHLSARSLQEVQAVAMTENREQPDGRVCPLHERLARIFGLGEPLPEHMREDVALAFLKPIFACAKKYDDVDPTLLALRAKGYRLAIVSNTPWGSPSSLWADELKRLGLAHAVDLSLFCVDVGWRKPALPLFTATSDALRVKPSECVFVGDHPRWDYDGALNAGMIPVLLDRTRTLAANGRNVIFSLADVQDLLDDF